MAAKCDGVIMLTLRADPSELITELALASLPAIVYFFTLNFLFMAFSFCCRITRMFSADLDVEKMGIDGIRTSV